MHNTYLAGGVAGGLAFAAAMIVSNVLFFQLGSTVLFDPSLQSTKVISVLFEQEPLPLMFTNGPLYMLLGTLIGVVHGLVFVYLLPAFPQSVFKRGLAYSGILWLLMVLYFEFHTPFNMFGEPIQLVALELVLWVPVVLIEGVLLSTVYAKLVRTKARTVG